MDLMGVMYTKYLEWILAHPKSSIKLNSLFTWHQARQNRQQQRNSLAPVSAYTEEANGFTNRRTCDFENFTTVFVEGITTPDV